MSTTFHDNPIAPTEDQPATPLAAVPHGAASRGLAAMFGLDIRAAVLAILVDVMVFGVDTFSVETLLPLGIAVAAVLGFITYKIQRKADDDHDTALIKAASIALVTAIPVPLTPLVAVPGGMLGIVNAIRRKKSRTAIEPPQ
jgi:chromate transport protein ChrA